MERKGGKGGGDGGSRILEGKEIKPNKKVEGESSKKKKSKKGSDKGKRDKSNASDELTVNVTDRDAPNYDSVASLDSDSPESLPPTPRRSGSQDAGKKSTQG